MAIKAAKIAVSAEIGNWPAALIFSVHFNGCMGLTNAWESYGS
jgi:hypothetical protein